MDKIEEQFQNRYNNKSFEEFIIEITNFSLKNKFNLIDKAELEHQKQLDSIISYETCIDSNDDEILIVSFNYKENEEYACNSEQLFIRKIMKENYINDSLVISNNQSDTWHISYYKMFYKPNKDKNIIQTLKQTIFDNKSCPLKDISLDEKYNVNDIYSIFSIGKSKTVINKSTQKTENKKETQNKKENLSIKKETTSIKEETNQEKQSKLIKEKNLTKSDITHIYKILLNDLEYNKELTIRRKKKTLRVLYNTKDIAFITKNEDYIELQLYKPLPELKLEDTKIDYDDVKDRIYVYIENENELDTISEIFKRL